jgi:hypothetical protein
VPATTDLEARLLDGLAEELDIEAPESGRLGFLSAAVTGPGADGPLPPAAESVGAGFDGQLLGTKLAGMSDLGSELGRQRPTEHSATGTIGDVELTVGIEVGGPGEDVGVSMQARQGDTEASSRWRGRIAGDPCPDADGKIQITYKVTVEDAGSTTAGFAASRTTTAEGTATGSVNDAAMLTAVEFAGTTTDRFTDPARSAWVETKAAGTVDIIGDVDRGQTAVPHGRAAVSRASSQATRADKSAGLASAGEAVKLITAMLRSWEYDWRAGRCVKIRADIPLNVAPSSQHAFDVHVVHRDGSELDAPVDATLSGTRSLDPLRIEHAPAQLTYTAGDQKGDRATIDLVSTSRRGIGKLSGTIKVEQQGYRMQGGADELVVDAVVCDLTKPFTVTGSGITLDFVPSSTDPTSGGIYSYRGDFKKFKVSGKGTYTVKLNGSGEGSLVAKGPGKAKAPAGTFTTTDKETYRLVPMTCE